MHSEALKMDKLKLIKEQLIDVLNLPYSFMEWENDEIPKTYWIGEIQEVPITTENGYEESIFILTGTTRGKWFDLLSVKDDIKTNFSPIYGLRKSTDSGSIAVFYENSLPVPTGEAEIKRLQINLRIKEWKGMI